MEGSKQLYLMKTANRIEINVKTGNRITATLLPWSLLVKMITVIVVGVPGWCVNLVSVQVHNI